MQPFTSKELYIMNGGNKMYIGKDGFADVYNATPAEEAQWTAELIATNLEKINTETNDSNLQLAVDNLFFHQYPELKTLLISKLTDTNPVRRVVFAAVLWNMYRYPASFGILIQSFALHRKECINEVFHALWKFKGHEGAKEFLYDCTASGDEELKAKAKTCFSFWV